MGAESSPKIVIVDESPIRAAILEEGLREAGFTSVVHISEMQSLLARIYALDPDVIVIDLENPSRDVLEQMFQVSRAVRRPIAMFVDQSDAASIQASVDAGVSAYIVDGLKKERSSRSSTSAFRASTLSRSCRTNSIAPNPRWKTAR
jgi:response regulator NasT